MKEFTDADVHSPWAGADGYICAERADLVYDPPEWMARGLQQTSSGYGRKLNSGLKIHFNGRLYRIYITIFSNAGSSWFTAKGRRYYIR